MLKGQKRKLEVEDKEEEIDDFDEDIRLMKKLKKGKVSCIIFFFFLWSIACGISYYVCLCE